MKPAKPIDNCQRLPLLCALDPCQAGPDAWRKNPGLYPTNESTPMKILFAADGSQYTRRAAKYLVQHATMFGCKPEIAILNVHVPIPYRGAGAVVGKAAVERYYRDEAHAALAPACSLLDKAGLRYTSSWVVGDVAAEIAAQAKKLGADLIVMGSHGEGALANLVLGSVTTKVLACCKVPVLVVR